MLGGPGPQRRPRGVHVDGVDPGRSRRPRGGGPGRHRRRGLRPHRRGYPWVRRLRRGVRRRRHPRDLSRRFGHGHDPRCRGRRGRHRRVRPGARSDPNRVRAIRGRRQGRRGGRRGPLGRPRRRAVGQVDVRRVGCGRGAGGRARRDGHRRRGAARPDRRSTPRRRGARRGPSRPSAARNGGPRPSTDHVTGATGIRACACRPLRTRAAADLGPPRRAASGRHRLPRAGPGGADRRRPPTRQ